MIIGIVGGVDRAAAILQDVAEAQGHALEFHSGVMSSGTAAARLRALVGRVELVVVITDVNSHNGVRAARREAQHRGRPVRIVRRLGSVQLATLLQDLPGKYP